MPSARLRAYRREMVIAEKLGALFTLGLQNSRLKDYSNLWFLGHRFPFEGLRLPPPSGEPPDGSVFRYPSFMSITVDEGPGPSGL